MLVSGGRACSSVEDIGRSHELLAAREVVFVEKGARRHQLPDHDLWLASFRDSEDNLLALMSEVRPGA